MTFPRYEFTSFQRVRRERERESKHRVSHTYTYYTCSASGDSKTLWMYTRGQLN